MDTLQKIVESNAIEGIFRPPTEAEVFEHERFMGIPQVTVNELITFVRVYQPNAMLRTQPGQDVRVGNHYPPPGGPDIRDELEHLLEQVNKREISAWNAHIWYETLHPFTDGNGRSGRMLWYWMMRLHQMASLGFLHAFYYQTLQNRNRGNRE